LRIVGIVVADVRIVWLIVFGFDYAIALGFYDAVWLQFALVWISGFEFAVTKALVWIIFILWLFRVTNVGVIQKKTLNYIIVINFILLLLLRLQVADDGVANQFRIFDIFQFLKLVLVEHISPFFG